MISARGSNLSHSWKSYLRRYFDDAAERYEAEIAPAVARLSKGLVDLAKIEQDESVLDLGCGTGAVARIALQVTRQVVAIDYSLGMLQHSNMMQNGILAQADMHSLCFRDVSFDCILASFAFNSCNPIEAFAEAFRVLARGGRLVLQEWGEVDEVSSMFSDTVAEYCVDNPSPSLVKMRNQMAQATPWDEIESLEDLAYALQATGFSTAPVMVSTEAIVFEDVEHFMRYKFAWPSRNAELEAMPFESRHLCISDLRENLVAIANPSGSLTWKPEIIRIVARRPAS